MSDPMTRSRFLRCVKCGKIITRLEWEAFAFSDTYRCCGEMNLRPYEIRICRHV